MSPKHFSFGNYGLGDAECGYTRLGPARPITGTLAAPDALFFPKDHIGHLDCCDVVETSVRWGKVNAAVPHIFFGATTVTGPPPRVPLATRSIWLFSKKAEASPPPAPTPPPETLVSESVAPVPAATPVAATPPPTPAAADDAVTQVAALPQSDTLDTLAALAPLQYGDLTALGLAGWSPAGLSSWLLELLRNSGALAPHQPRLLELKEELNQAYQKGDKIGVQRVALKQRRVYEESGVSMLPMLLMPFVQLPVTLGMFFGVKRLCALPLEQLHWSGVSFLPDLTVPDPFYVLPIAAAVLMNVQLSVGASDMAATADRTTAAHMINAFRVVSVISIPLMGQFPSGLNLYVLTGIAAMLVQTSVLRKDAVRRILRIPLLPKNTNVKPVTFQESIDHLKKWFREQNRIAQERAQKGRKW
ncbi:60Kd inner membrane protein-domain-containing protein [Lactarius psammicola]|nr:60Kd inner membrane protein-domain-containing protein [Lactarius psammicola]